jgi:HPr kinase/phosphorylase
MTDDFSLIHATCVAVDGAGVLLRGAPGGGKSDLALRLIDGGALLVADDQVALAAEGGALVARAPATLRGKLEVRGLGIVEMPPLDAAPVALVVDLVVREAVERLPDRDRCSLFGHSLRWMEMAAFDASAPAKVRLAVALAKRDSSAATKAS